MSTHKPFREIVPSGTNFEFIGKTRVWVMISMLLIAGSIAMLFVNKSMRGDYLNWTIDFKGGTEIIFAFKDGQGKYTKVDAGKVRTTLQAAGYAGFDVSEFGLGTETESGETEQVDAILVRTSDFGALNPDKAKAISDEFVAKFQAEGKELSAGFSGDTLFVRGTMLVEEADAKAFLATKNLDMKPWGTQADRFRTKPEGSDQYSAEYSVFGIDTQYQEVLAKELGNDVVTMQVYGVGATAGSKLRDDGIKSLFYAMALIMLYLAFRFDIRYAPGAVVALLHDALMVVGVFAVTWQEVSLTSVAALLTVIGYSVNDTVIIFDRIRENVERLKDKKFARIINISLNETLSRTILTSLTLFVVTLMMNIFGTGLVKNFAFAMNIGVIVGVYSSVFIASPVALAIHNRWFAAK